MSGPWEAFGAGPAGPWKAYADAPAQPPGGLEDVARSALAHLTHLGASLGAGLGDVPAMARSAASAGQHLGEAITGQKSGTDFGKVAGDAAATVLNTFGLTPQSSIQPAGGRPVDRAVQALVAQKAAQVSGNPQGAAQAGAAARRAITSRGPTSSQTADAVPGGSYRAQTMPGKVAGALVDFSPALAGSEGTIPQRIAQWVAPALASEGAGALTAGTPFEQPARFGAAVLAGGLVAPRSEPGAAPVEELSTPERRVGAAFGRAMRRDSLTPDDLRTFAADNPDAATFHVGGPNVASLAEVAAQSPGPAQRMVRSAVLDDQAAAPRQAADMIGESLGGKGDYFASLEDAIKTRRTAADTAMASIERSPVQLGPDATVALRSELAQGAVRKAAQEALASVDPVVREAGYRLNGLADSVLENAPNGVQIDLRSAQDISKSLKDAAESAFRSGDGSRGIALSGLSKAIRGNAADPAQGGVPGYAEWLTKYGDHSDNISALEMGRNAFSGSKQVSAEQIGRDLGKMSPDALDYYRKGVGEAVLDKVRKGGVIGLRQAMKDEYGDRIKLAFPDEGAFQGFQQNLEGLLERHDRNGTVIGSSRTFARGAAADDLSQQHGIDPVDAASTVMDGVMHPAGLAAKGAKHLLDAIPRKDRSIIGNDQTSAILGKVLTDPEEADRILRLYQSRRAPPNVGAIAGRALRPTVLLPAAIAARQGQ